MSELSQRFDLYVSRLSLDPQLLFDVARHTFVMKKNRTFSLEVTGLIEYFGRQNFVLLLFSVPSFFLMECTNYKPLDLIHFFYLYHFIVYKLQKVFLFQRFM